MPAEKWLAVQKRFERNTFDKTMKYDIPLLKGSLRCAKCNALMQVSRKKRKVGVTSHYYCLTRSRKGVDACDMRFIKCEVLDEKALKVFQEIEDDPSLIMKYVKPKHPQKPGKDLRSLESDASRINAKIERLTETLAEAEGSTATKYILSQIEKEDLNLAAIRREIEIAKAKAKKERKIEKSTEAKAAEIARLIQGLNNFSAADRNAIVREVVQECTWDGETLFLRL